MGIFFLTLVVIVLVIAFVLFFVRNSYKQKLEIIIEVPKNYLKETEVYTIAIMCLEEQSLSKFVVSEQLNSILVTDRVILAQDNTFIVPKGRYQLYLNVNHRYKKPERSLEFIKNLASSNVFFVKQAICDFDVSFVESADDVFSISYLLKKSEGTLFFIY